MISFFLSCKLPPNSEGSGEQSEAKRASLRTEVRIIFPFLLTLAPSVSSADTFPDKRGRLTGCILPLFFKHAAIGANLRTQENDGLPK